ncbi:iron chelate uptake ABC transporter family permease subunit [Streptomyces sp. NPDC052020]|uniref:FecCD family ABC transporter permease n=1 Tax=Streptomyces sp. NPDC052020 TaxID=3155677 RepID=UPI0034481A7F
MSLLQDGPARARVQVRRGLLRTRRWLLRYDTRALLVCALLGALTVCAMVSAIGTGTYALSPPEVLSTLTGDGPPGAGFVVFDLRLPQALVAALVGFGLGMAGAVFQSLTRNPLGCPDVIVYLLAWKRGVHGYRLVLVGIGASSVLGAATGFLYLRADIGKAAQAAAWTVGSLNARDWSDVRVAALGLVVLVPVVLVYGRRLTMLEMGDDTAAALGVPPERSRLVLLGAGTGLTAMAVAAAGPVPFVAMAAPQLARRMTRAAGPNVLSAGWMGALLVTAADLVTQRVTGSARLPVGVVTGVAGGVYLAWLCAASVGNRGCDGQADRRGAAHLRGTTSCGAGIPTPPLPAVCFPGSERDRRRAHRHHLPE